MAGVGHFSIFNKNQSFFYFQLKPLKQRQTLLVLLLYACMLCQSLPQLRPSQRLSFTNLRDFITQLKTSSTLSRESLDNIKTNIQNIGKIEQPPPEVTTTAPTRRPPYMFQGLELLFLNVFFSCRLNGWQALETSRSVSSSAKM